MNDSQDRYTEPAVSEPDGEFWNVYGCVQCQRDHYREIEPVLFGRHIMRQSKDGMRHADEKEIERARSG